MRNDRRLSPLLKAVIIAVIVTFGSLAVTFIVYISNPNLPYSPFSSQSASTEKYSPLENYTVSLTATNGEVSVIPNEEGWIYVTANVWTYFFSTPKLNISSSISGNSFSFTVTSPLFTFRGPEINLYVPAGLYSSSLAVNVTNGNINIDFPASSHYLSARTSNGNIEINSQSIEVLTENTANGNINAHLNDAKNLSLITRNGNINLEITNKISSGVQDITTTNGNVAVKIHPTSQLNLSASVTNGRVSWSNLNIVSSISNDKNLVGVLNGGGGIMTLKSTNGNVFITSV